VILYLHGFTSGPQSAKSQALRERMAARGMADQFSCPQLPAAPADAIALAEDIIAEEVSRGGTPALVGSSLGGYYATYLAEMHSLKAVLVNPAVAGSVDVAQFVGPQRFLYTGEAFDFTLDHVEQLRALDVPKPTRPERYWLLVETGDEVLDYRAAVARHAAAKQTILPGGDHSFTRWTDYLDDVIGFCQ
jgi:hypothetical protein